MLSHRIPHNFHVGSFSHPHHRTFLPFLFPLPSMTFNFISQTFYFTNLLEKSFSLFTSIPNSEFLPLRQHPVSEKIHAKIPDGLLVNSKRSTAFMISIHHQFLINLSNKTKTTIRIKILCKRRRPTTSKLWRKSQDLPESQFSQHHRSLQLNQTTFATKTMSEL